VDLVLQTLAAAIVAAGSLVVLIGVAYLLSLRKQRKNKKPRKPKKTKIEKIEGSDMADQLRYTLAIPEPGAGDVVTRELHVVVDGIDTTYTLTPDVRSFTVDLVEGTSVSIFLVDVDNIGNRSEPGEALTFTVVDTIPPPKPLPPVVIGVEEPGYQTGPLPGPAFAESDFLKAAKAVLKK